MYVYVVALVLLSGYLLSSVYNFLWIVHSKVGALSKFLYGCKRQAESYSEIVQKNAAGPVINLKLYFKVRYFE